MKPILKKYLDVYQFLQDFYQFRKDQEPTFSYETWAKELGASDKSYVRFLVIGKRPINEKMSVAFSENINLSFADKKYFFTLIQYTQSKTHTQKEIFGQKLISMLKTELDQLEIEAHYEFLSSPLLPRLQVFLGFRDLDQSPKNLAWLLGATEVEIIEAFKKLENFKLIEKVDGRFTPLKKSFKVGDHFGDLGLEAFYKSNLEAAKASIQLPKNERRFKSLFLPLNGEEFELFLKNMNAFTSEQLYRFNPSDFADRRLYQVHLNIIPISNGIKDEIMLKPQTEV